jgi:transcriptional regulator with XRE-family HTH domain
MGRSIKLREDCLANIKGCLRRQGYARQQDLAEEMGISRSTLSHYLNGRSVDHQTFMEISDALGVDWQTVADFSSAEPSPTKASMAAPIMVDATDKATMVAQSIGELEEFEPFIYIERPPVEMSCQDAIQKPGALLRIKAPWLMGKTALSYRLLGQVKEQGWHTVSLNFHLASRDEFGSLGQFLKWFCSGISQLLQRPNQLECYWDEEYSTPKMSCTDYFERYLLPGLDGPLVLCLDEVDRIFPHAEIAVDFFGLLRAWHERAKLSPIWQKLRLILIYSTEVYIPLNLYESPFNVGQFMELPLFSAVQVGELARRSALNWRDGDIEAVMLWLGGHPAYVQRTIGVCQRGGMALAQVWEQAATDAGIYGSELRHLWRMVERRPELVALLRQAIALEPVTPLQSDDLHQLYRLGLVRFHPEVMKHKNKLKGKA